MAGVNLAFGILALNSSVANQLICLLVISVYIIRQQCRLRPRRHFFHFHAVFGKSYARSATDSVFQLKEDKKPTRTVKVFLEEIYVFTGW